jgi:hypothetical protein
LTRSFDGELYAAADEHGPPRFLQQPFVRILIQGRIGVTIFSFVTGYVCALKPIRLYRQGNHSVAFSSIAKSALRRTPRLFLPAALATTLIWVLAQLGAFIIARHSNGGWARDTSPDVKTSVFSAIYSLFSAIIETWTHGKNYYDGNQWTMMPLLRGSMLTYVYIIATSYVRPRNRMMATLGMYLYFWMAGEGE